MLKNRSLVTIAFREVVDLMIEDFNHQNALLGLRILDVSDQQIDHVQFEIHFDSAYGMAASFACYAVEVLDVQPWPDSSVRS